MPSFQNFTTKAKEAIRKAHELAIERGQNHVNPVHLLTALSMQDESMVISVLDHMDVDVIAFTDLLLDALEGSDLQSNVSQSYQLYLTPELARALEYSGQLAEQMGDSYVGVEHLFIAVIENPGPAQEMLKRSVMYRDERLTAETIASSVIRTPWKSSYFSAIPRKIAIASS